MIVVDFMPKVFIVQTMNVCVNEETGHREDIMRTAAAFTDPAVAHAHIATLSHWNCETHIVSANGEKLSLVEAQCLSIEDLEVWAELTPANHRVQIPSEI